MGNIEFVWGPSKAKTNIAKHAVTFEEAQTVFYDEAARLINDPDHSADENRFIMLGYSANSRCLIVIHCYRESDSAIRLISARIANKKEEASYWSFR